LYSCLSLTSLNRLPLHLIIISMQGWFAILIFVILSFLLIGFVVVLSSILGPKKRVKNLEPYECGIIPRGSPRVRISLRYYTIALLFLIFDVELALLFPWATKVEKFGVAGLIEVGIFAFILFFGLFYLWRKGGLEWD